MIAEDRMGLEVRSAWGRRVGVRMGGGMIVGTVEQNRSQGQSIEIDIASAQDTRDFRIFLFSLTHL